MVSDGHYRRINFLSLSILFKVIEFLLYLLISASFLNSNLLNFICCSTTVISNFVALYAGYVIAMETLDTSATLTEDFPAAASSCELSINYVVSFSFDLFRSFLVNIKS